MQQHFLPFLMDGERSHEDRWLALLLISDLIEHAPSSGRHVAPLFPKFLEYATSDNKELVQVCCYCLGIVAEKHGQVRSPLVSASCPFRCAVLVTEPCYRSACAVHARVGCDERNTYFIRTYREWEN